MANAVATPRSQSCKVNNFNRLRYPRIQRWPGRRGPPCRLEGRSAGHGPEAISASSGRGRITIQGIFYRDLGAFLSRSRARIPAWRGHGRQILAISDTRQTEPPESATFCPARRDKRPYRVTSMRRSHVIDVIEGTKPVCCRSSMTVLALGLLMTCCGHASPASSHARRSGFLDGLRR